MYFYSREQKTPPAWNANPQWIDDIDPRHLINAKKTPMPKFLPPRQRDRRKGERAAIRWQRKIIKNKHIKHNIFTLFPRHCTSRRPPSAIPPLLSSLRWSCAEGLKEGRKGGDQMTSKYIIKNKHRKNNILTLFPRHCTSPPPAVHGSPAAPSS